MAKHDPDEDSSTGVHRPPAQHRILDQMDDRRREVTTHTVSIEEVNIGTRTERALAF